MNRKEMLARLKVGEDALELSIEKWQDIVDGKGKDQKAENCALCEIDHKSKKDECLACIIFKKTGETDCFKTPYTQYLNSWEPKDLRKYAIKEVEFLKSLRPKEKKKG